METNKKLSKNELSTEEYRKLLKYLAEKSNTLFLTFTGGEFFLRKDAIELTRIASEFNYCFSILSNGILIDEKIADALAETVPMKMRFTLFSYIPELHDDFTGIKGSFNKTINAIRLMRERDITTHISYPILNITKEIDFDKICEFMDNLDVQFTLSTTILPPRKRDVEQSEISYFSDSSEFSKITNDMKKYIEKNSEYYSSDIEQLDTLKDNAKKTGLYIPCSAGVNSLAVNPYGDISPCAMFFDTVVLGNVRNDDILDIF
ncbi:MAG: radical SAM protein, partial [Candidatus Coatesbacteria bacterium]|nr:radical SAM protein [Candidatus Coatesbacteria bacterium]